MPSMRSFAKTFFKHFGTQITPGKDELVVDLPPDLIDVFGKPRLYLVFPTGDGESRELSPTEDLLVYGSRTFDQMLTLLAGRGEAAHLHFPARVAVPKDDTPPLTLFNCRLDKSQLLHTKDDPYYVFNFRAVYISDEKQEEFITVVLDGEGRPAPDHVSMLTDVDTSLLSSDSPRQVDPETVRRMLSHAEDVARQQVDKQAAELEIAIQTRLEKALIRLTTYYRRLADEINNNDPAQAEAVRADLQRDLQRKISDEVERRRLRVTLSPISYAVAWLPFARYRLNLTTRHSQQIIDLNQNLHTGQIIHFNKVGEQKQSFACHHCREPLDHLALCDRGHVVHPHCLNTCRRCDKDTCRTCGIQACAICANPVCIDCIAACAHCERWLCVEHIETCAICGVSFCTDHSFRCRWCNQLYCRQCQLGHQCDTCRAILSGSPFDVGTPIPAITGQKVSRYQWRQAENKVYNIYIGQSFVWGQFVIVTGKSGQVIHWEKIGLLKRIFGRRPQ